MFDPNVSELVAKYQRKGILLDTNVLLLLAIGQYSTDRIERFKRTAVYTPRDYGLLMNLVAQFEARWTTPNILTEVDNLGRQLPKEEHTALSASMRKIANATIEISRPSKLAIGQAIYERLGLSDAVSVSLSAECLVVSDDLPLCMHNQSSGNDALNFNHLRL